MKIKIVIISLFFSNFVLAQKTVFYLKLNALDCSTCVNGMTQLKNNLNKENSLIVIQKKYKRDSISIEKKFLLSEYNLKIIWSDSLYSKISKNEKTELVIVQDNKGNINLLLTQIDYKNLFHNENSLKDSICGIVLPSIVKIKEKGNKLGIKNYVSGEIYIYAKNGNIDTFYAPYKITRQYKLQLFDTLKNDLDFNTYCQAINQQANLRPVFTTFNCYENDQNELFLTTYNLKNGILNNNKPRADKMYSVVFTTKQNIDSILLFNENGLNLLGYHVAEGCNFFKYKDYYYFQSYKKTADSVVNDRNYSSHKMFAKFKIQNHEFKFIELMKYEMPDVYKNFNLQSMNLFNISSENFVMFPYAKNFFDVETRKEYILPLPDSLINEFQKFKSKEINFTPFSIIDIKKMDENNIAFLYIIHENFYYSLFNLVNQQFVNTKYLPECNSEKKLICYPCFANNGKSILLPYNEGDCIGVLDL